MNKTSVYLDDADIARLRKLRAATGRSQSELLRAGIRALAGDDDSDDLPRMRSIGSGNWTLDDARWAADDLARRRGLG